MSTFSAAAAAFASLFRASRRTVPESIHRKDLTLIAIATYKISRVIAKDRVTSAIRAPFTTFQDDAGPGEVQEAARGTGMVGYLSPSVSLTRIAGGPPAVCRGRGRLESGKPDCG
jgi:Protein of unknown function (DUF1360)